MRAFLKSSILMLCAGLAVPATAAVGIVPVKVAAPVTGMGLAPGAPSLNGQSFSGLSLQAASLTPVLGLEQHYQALLARQDMGEKLDLSAVVRPGIARSNAANLKVMQGSGRFEKLRAGDSADLFVPETDPLPEGAVVVEKGIPGSLVQTINTLSSRGQAGANPEFVAMYTGDRSFVRVLAPRQLVRAPMSVLAFWKKELEGKLRALDAQRGEALLASDSYQAMSLAEQNEVLTGLVGPADAGESR